MSGTEARSTPLRAGAEERAQAALRDAHPDLAPGFEAALRQARATALGRLWVAVAREGLGGARAGAAGGQATLTLPDGVRLAAPPAVVDAFAEHPPGLAVVVEGPEPRTIQHPVDLLEVVASARPSDGDGQAWSGLLRELAESVANHALALVGETHRRERRGFAGLGAAAPGALRWSAERAAADPGFSPLALFEQAIVDGHPLHPCAKIRGGMAVEELFALAPEWVEEIPARIAAVAARVFDGGPAVTRLLDRWHPRAAAAARAHLERLGRDPAGYELLPVHPWQFERLGARFPGPLDDGRIVPAEPARIPARPLLSFRTLVPAANRRAPHLKTAVDVRLTTAVRGVSPSAAANGPAISTLLARISGARGWFGGRFATLAELAGGGFAPGPGEPADGASSLSAIVREAAESGLRSGEVALPTAALAARSPTTGRVLLADALDELVAVRGVAAPEAGAVFLGAYCDCALPPLLTLVSRWGIGLEAHGENLVVVLAGGLPVRMLYRDFGGIRIRPARLAAQGLRSPALTGAPPTDDDDELRAKFLFPLVETNLGQLVSALVRAGACDAARAWDLIARRCRAVYARLAADRALRAQSRGDEEALFGPLLPVKSMLRTQLSATPHDARWVAVPNPLAGASRRSPAQPPSRSGSHPVG